MVDPHEVFGGAAGAGLHRLDRALGAEDLAEMAAAHGWSAIVVELAEVTDKAGLLARFREAGRFPGYTGRNWDALQDALGDLSWLGPVEGHLVVLDGWDRFAEAAPADAKVADALLAQAATEWSARSTPFVTLVL